MSAWLAQHRAALALTGRRLLRLPATSAVTLLAIGVSAALPALLWLLAEHLAGLGPRFATSRELTVVLTEGLPAARRQALAAKLTRDPEVATVRFLSREQAARDLGHRLGLSDVLAALGDNPLPDALIVLPKSAAGDLGALKSRLAREPGVVKVLFDAEVAERLGAWLALGQRLAMAFAAVLALGLVAVAFNNTRMQVLLHREEIEVSRLLGATPAFVRRPFLYLGAVQGSLGGVVALGLTFAAVVFVEPRVAALAQAYGTPFPVRGLNFEEAGVLVLACGVLGWLGAWLAASRELRE